MVGLFYVENDGNDDTISNGYYYAQALGMDTAIVARGHASAMNGILVTARGGL